MVDGWLGNVHRIRHSTMLAHQNELKSWNPFIRLGHCCTSSLLVEKRDFDLHPKFIPKHIFLWESYWVIGVYLGFHNAIVKEWSTQLLVRVKSALVVNSLFRVFWELYTNGIIFQSLAQPFVCNCGVTCSTPSVSSFCWATFELDDFAEIYKMKDFTSAEYGRKMWDGEKIAVTVTFSSWTGSTLSSHGKTTYYL